MRPLMMASFAVVGIVVAAQGPSFEVASIKRNAAGPGPH